MILPGHVASAYLASRATGASLKGSLAASMFPDFVDKPVRWILDVTPNDRIPAHTAWFWLGTTLLARLVAGHRVAQGWAVGYGAHLLGDEINAHLNPGRIYFWWPLKRYRLHCGPTGLSSSLADFSRASLLVEGGVALAALGVALFGGRAGSIVQGGD
jgi:hypothetical protein